MSRKVGKLSDLKWPFRQTLRKLLPREIVSLEVLLISVGDNLLLQVFAAPRWVGGWVVEVMCVSARLILKTIYRSEAVSTGPVRSEP